VKDKLIWLFIALVGGGTLFWLCAPQTWRDRKNWDTSPASTTTTAQPQGPQKQVMSEQYIYKNGAKYRETWYRYK
jgi:hypothetical protein